MADTKNDTDRHQQYWYATWTHIFSPAVLHEFRFTFGNRVSTWCRQIFKLAALWERDHNYFSARSSDLIFPELRTVTDTRRPAFRVADARCGPGGRGPGARSMGHWPQRANVWRTVTSLGRDKTTKKRSTRNRTAEATQ